MQRHAPFDPVAAPALGGWDVRTINTWHRATPGTAYVFYDHPSLGGMFALASGNADNANGVVFFPHADGTPPVTLRVGSDYRVMAANICRRTRQGLHALTWYRAAVAAGDWRAADELVQVDQLLDADCGGEVGLL